MSTDLEGVLESLQPLDNKFMEGQFADSPMLCYVFDHRQIDPMRWTEFLARHDVWWLPPLGFDS